MSLGLVVTLTGALWGGSLAGASPLEGVASAVAVEGVASPASVEDTVAAPLEATERVLVLPLRLGATVDAAVRPELQAALERGLGRGRLVPFRDAQADACGDDACVQRRARAHEARYVLRGTVEERDRNFSTVLRLLDATTLEPVAQARRECEVCGSAELLETIADQGAALGARPTVEAPRLGVLLLRTRPPGARVRVDGEVVGTTPARHELPGGRHRVVFERAGYQPVERSVVATVGVEERVDVALTRRRRPLRIVGGTLLGAGLVAAGVGGALLAVDGRPDRRRCTGDDVDFEGRCRFSWETGTAGVVTTVGGVALVATGVSLLIVTALRSSRRSAAAAGRPPWRPALARRHRPAGLRRSAAP